MAIAERQPFESVSWLHYRMPEMLWAALVFTESKDMAYGYFNSLFEFIVEHPQKNLLGDLTLSGIARIDESLRTTLLKEILQFSGAQEALRELLRYSTLPMFDVWREHLSPPQNIELLLEAVQSVLWHQSECATACRWVRVMGLMASGKVHFLPQTRDTAELIVSYPHGDLQKARPSIRATEIGFQDLISTSPDSWAESFWKESWKQSKCLLPERQYNAPALDSILTRSKLNEVRNRLTDHWQRTHPSTAPEAKHDAVFGMTLYCVRVLEEMLGIGISSSTLGRMGLRTILEVNVSLAYLVDHNQDELWKKWREYGVGQAKLSVLKYEDSVDPPDYVDLSNIQQIAFEDKSPEFVSIDLSGWSGMDLRKMSERVGLKDLYDQHYPLSSGFVHGSWSAVRESVWETCANPLHRLHRIPSRNSLSETVESAAELVDAILQRVDVIYPSFPWRLLELAEENQ